MSENKNKDSSFGESFWRYIRPLPSSDEKKPVVTGFGAIKKNMLPEHGGESLTSIQEKNTVINALKGGVK